MQEDRPEENRSNTFSSRLALPSGHDQVVVPGELDELVDAPDLQFAEDIGPVVVGGLGGDAEHITDLPAGIPLRHQLQYLLLLMPSLPQLRFDMVIRFFEGDRLELQL